MAFFLLGAMVVLQAETVTITSSADTTLFGESPTNNLGAVPTLIGGTTAHGYANRPLIRFDLGQSIPSNAIIDAVNLTLTLVVAHQMFGVESIFDLHRVLRPWGEGNKVSLNPKLGEAATDGEATWNARFHPATLWASAGAAEGTDYSGAVSSSQLIGNVVPQTYTFGSTAELVADVQSWLTNAAGNFGWILISQSEGTAFTAKRFGSREDPPNAPMLEVQYSIPPREPRIDRVERMGNNLNLHFTAEAMFCYAVEFRNSLTTGAWSTLTNVCAPVSTQNVVVPDSLSASPSRFYRLNRTPIVMP